MPPLTLKVSAAAASEELPEVVERAGERSGVGVDDAAGWMG